MKFARELMNNKDLKSLQDNKNLIVNVFQMGSYFFYQHILDFQISDWCTIFFWVASTRCKYCVWNMKRNFVSNVDFWNTHNFFFFFGIKSARTTWRCLTISLICCRLADLYRSIFSTPWGHHLQGVCDSMWI